MKEMLSLLRGLGRAYQIHRFAGAGEPGAARLGFRALGRFQIREAFFQLSILRVLSAEFLFHLIHILRNFPAHLVGMDDLDPEAPSGVGTYQGA